MERRKMEKKGDQDPGDAQRLRAAFHYTVACLCEEVGEDKETQFSRQAIAAISEITFRQCEIFAKDLEMFARHAKRTTVNVEDVKLLARKSNSLLRYVTQKSEELALNNLEQKKKKKTKKGRASDELAEPAVAQNGDSTDDLENFKVTVSRVDSGVACGRIEPDGIPCASSIRSVPAGAHLILPVHGGCNSCYTSNPRRACVETQQAQSYACLHADRSHCFQWSFLSGYTSLVGVGFLCAPVYGWKAVGWDTLKHLQGPADLKWNQLLAFLSGLADWANRMNVAPLSRQEKIVRGPREEKVSLFQHPAREKAPCKNFFWKTFSSC